MMQYDPIQGQCQGHEPLKVGNSAIFKGYLLFVQQPPKRESEWGCFVANKFD